MKRYASHWLLCLLIIGMMLLSEMSVVYVYLSQHIHAHGTFSFPAVYFHTLSGMGVVCITEPAGSGCARTVRSATVQPAHNRIGNHQEHDPTGKGVSIFLYGQPSSWWSVMFLHGVNRHPLLMFVERNHGARWMGTHPDREEEYRTRRKRFPSFEGWERSQVLIIIILMLVSVQQNSFTIWDSYWYSLTAALIERGLLLWCRSKFQCLKPSFHFPFHYRSVLKGGCCEVTNIFDWGLGVVK
jgi:hypothetical protein